MKKAISEIQNDTIFIWIKPS